MDYSDIMNALKQADADYSAHTSLALSAVQHSKDEAKDEAMNKALLAEGFRPFITPDKQEIWMPKPKVATDDIHAFQKSSGSMSGNLLMQTYPFLQYAVKNFLPVMDSLIEGVKNQDFPLQHLKEQTLALAQGGLDEAIKATGGLGKQGKGSIADSTSAKETAEIIMKEKNAYKQLIKVSDYAKNGYTS